MNKFVCKFVLASALMLGMVGSSFAGAIDVNFTVSGSSGDYTVDFTVTNNMTAFPDQDVYYFGVAMAAHDITGSPAEYPGYFETAWSNAPYGGSNIIYNNNWSENLPNGQYIHLLPGNSLSGFEVHTTDIVAPMSIHWFAYSFNGYGGAPYTGGGNFFSGVNGNNPGFEGVSGVPEPSSLALLGIGGLAFGVYRRRQAKLTNAA